MTKRLFITMVVLSFFSCNCGDTDEGLKFDEGPVYGQMVKIDNEILQIRTKADETLTIGSNSFVLEAYLWRDFMPICPPNGKLMISINWLVSTESAKIPDNISMVKQYVFYKDSVWVSNYENVIPTPSLPENKKEGVSRNGPKWGPNIYVDIISQIHDSKTNQDYFIEQKNVLIHKTS